MSIDRPSHDQFCTCYGCMAMFDLDRIWAKGEAKLKAERQRELAKEIGKPIIVAKQKHDVCCDCDDCWGPGLDELGKHIEKSHEIFRKGKSAATIHVMGIDYVINKPMVQSVIADDYECKCCGNTKLNHTEKSCWKCGEKISP